MKNDVRRASLALSIFVTVAAMTGVVAPASAEAYLVERVGAIGCAEREALHRIAEPADGSDISRVARTSQLADSGCSLLSRGERLLLVQEHGVGYAAVLRFQRGNGQVLYMASDTVVRDPACSTEANERK